MPKVPRTPTHDRLDAPPPDVHALPAGSTVWRIYFRGGRHPTRWNRFRRVGPTDARFDHQIELPAADQERAVLYASGDPVTCFAEVFQRTRLVNRRHNEPWLVGFETAAPAPLLDLTGALRHARGGVDGPDDRRAVRVPELGARVSTKPIRPASVSTIPRRCTPIGRRWS